MSASAALTVAETQATLDDVFADVVVTGAVGRGRRCVAFAARNGSRDIVVKLYHPRASARHQRQIGGSLAKYEYERNLAFHHYPGFAASSAAPIGLLSSPRAVLFLQERVFGEPLIPFLRAHSAACRSRVTADLQSMLERAEQAGMVDLDLHPTNIMVRRSRGGAPCPVLFDFNKVPYHVRRPNGIFDWCRSIGVFGSRSNDRRHLRRFNRVGWTFARSSASIRVVE